MILAKNLKSYYPEIPFSEIGSEIIIKFCCIQRIAKKKNKDKDKQLNSVI